MFARPVSDINWSNESFSTRDLMSKYPAPLLVRVTQGHCSLEDTDSLGQGQVIRIHRWLKQQRVIAINARGRYLSIPLDFEILFEIVPDKKRTLSKLKTISLASIIRQYSLPKKVRFSLSQLTSSQALDVGRHGVRITSEPIDLIRLHQEVYLNGNAVNFGELDATILSIPIHHDLEMSVALGLSSGDRNWHRLMRGLDNVVAKRVRFSTVQGNKKITIYNSETDDKNIVKKSTRNSEASLVQKRQHSLGRAFYYGTLQRTKVNNRDPNKPRPSSQSVDLGVLSRSSNQLTYDDSDGQTPSAPRVNMRQRFAKRKDARRNRGAEMNADITSISGTSTSATSMSESTTDTLDSELFWSNGELDDLDDDDKSDITRDDDDDDGGQEYMPRSLFGSVSRLSLFRPAYWSNSTNNIDGNLGSHQPKGWKAMKEKHDRRRRGSVNSLIMGTNISMDELHTGSRGMMKQNGLSSPSERGPPDGRSVVSDLDDNTEESTYL